MALSNKISPQLKMETRQWFECAWHWISSVVCWNSVSFFNWIGWVSRLCSVSMIQCLITSALKTGINALGTIFALVILFMVVFTVKQSLGGCPLCWIRHGLFFFLQDIQVEKKKQHGEFAGVDRFTKGNVLAELFPRLRFFSIFHTSILEFSCFTGAICTFVTAAINFFFVWLSLKTVCWRYVLTSWVGIKEICWK